MERTKAKDPSRTPRSTAARSRHVASVHSPHRRRDGAARLRRGARPTAPRWDPRSSSQAPARCGAGCSHATGPATRLRARARFHRGRITRGRARRAAELLALPRIHRRDEAITFAPTASRASSCCSRASATSRGSSRTSRCSGPRPHAVLRDPPGAIADAFVDALAERGRGRPRGQDRRRRDRQRRRHVSRGLYRRAARRRRRDRRQRRDRGRPRRADRRRGASAPRRGRRSTSTTAR